MSTQNFTGSGRTLEDAHTNALLAAARTLGGSVTAKIVEVASHVEQHEDKFSGGTMVSDKITVKVTVAASPA